MNQIDQTLLSVIVPVYNAEPYLGRCLDSICNQDYRNLEIICVDSGSKDGSLTILREYEKKDSRVRVVSKTLGSMASARNAGLTVATGEWVTGVDPKDYILPETYSSSMSHVTFKVDLICFGMKVEAALGSGKENEARVVQNRAVIPFQGEQKANAEMLCIPTWSLVNKLFRRSVIEKYHLRFDESDLGGEDLCFFLSYGAYIRRVYFIPELFYIHVLHADSGMQASANAEQRLKACLIVFSSIVKLYERVKKGEAYAPFYAFLYQETFSRIGHLAISAEQCKIWRERLFFLAVQHGLHEYAESALALLNAKPWGSADRLKSFVALYSQFRWRYNYHRILSKLTWGLKKNMHGKKWQAYRFIFQQVRRYIKNPPGPQVQEDYETKYNRINEQIVEHNARIIKKDWIESFLKADSVICSGFARKYLDYLFEKQDVQYAFLEERNTVANFALCHGSAAWYPQAETMEYALENGIPLIKVEDGFLKAADTWCSAYVDDVYTQGVSFTFTDSVFYFDATRESPLERMLNDKSLVITQEQRKRARACMDKIVSTRLTKYNHQPIYTPQIGRKGVKKVLVVDQSYGDMSIAKGWGSEEVFDNMLKGAIEDNPDADIIVKVHPDTLAAGSGRTGYFWDLKPHENIYLQQETINPISLLLYVDKVYVCTTQFGFEALMCGKEVHVFGMPFYAGWGLTHDRQRCERRTHIRTLEEVFYIAYIMASYYVNPLTKSRCEIEDAIDYLLNLRKQYFREHNIKNELNDGCEG